MKRETLNLVAMLVLAAVVTAPLPVGLVAAAAPPSVHHGALPLTADLTEFLSNSNGPEVPVVVHLREGYSAQAVADRLAEVPGVRVYRVLERISMVSVRASRDSVSDLARLHFVTLLSLDKTRSVPQLAVPHDGVRALSLSTYVHPDRVLGADKMWALGYDGTGVTVAVLDSGADGSHPDLAGRIAYFHDYIHDRDTPYDDNGHGTAVAWLVAGTGVANGGKYRGMAPGADLMVLKVLDASGQGDDSTIAEAILYAVDHGVDVVSLSLGGEWADSPVTDPSVSACRTAVGNGVVVVVAGGNSGPAASTVMSPGMTQEVITVGASVLDAGVVAFSSRGPVVHTRSVPRGSFAKPDVVAPGIGILSGRSSVVNDPQEYPVYNQSQYGDTYTMWAGTSASCPQVAGLAALLLQRHPWATPLDVKTSLMSGAHDLGADPMEQGWGLANVSRASEILSTGVPITIMTPKSYPTLPGTPVVLIVGDQRGPQNVTVISTADRGTAAIEVTGNASRFVNVSSESIDVREGYTYFGIGLSLPDAMPLNSTGQYVGVLSLVTDTGSIADMELTFTVATFGGRMLVDMAHHSSDDPDDPSSYRYFAEYLRENGVTMGTFGDPNDIAQRRFDRATLGTCEALLIMDTETNYGESEIAAFHDFVRDGGTLLVMSEYYDNRSNTASFGIDAYNKILEPFGIQCERFTVGGYPEENMGHVYGADHGGAVDDDPLTEGVRNIYVLLGSAFTVDPSRAHGLLWYDAARQHALVATARYGQGRVIAVSDGSTLYDDILYDAIRNGADNLALLHNIASLVIPEAPRIYEVQTKFDRIGQPGNVTAWVFDDDLSNVTITVTTPSGQNITSPVVERLGYEFMLDFPVDTGGFYVVTVRATDAAGHTKEVRETVLVPVPAVDDVFTMSVLGSLLVVVVAGLAYVGCKRFRRPMGGREEEVEWEPVWDDSGQTPPPVIE